MYTFENKQNKITAFIIKKKSRLKFKKRFLHNRILQL